MIRDWWSFSSSSDLIPKFLQSNKDTDEDEEEYEEGGEKKEKAKLENSFAAKQEANLNPKLHSGMKVYPTQLPS